MVKKKRKTQKKDTTTFGVGKQNAVQYKMGNHFSTIVTFEPRHFIGHRVVLALAALGIDVNDLVYENGKPKRSLQKAIEIMALIIKDTSPEEKKNTKKKLADRW